MKTNKQFTIDVDIAERLKETNASQLINSLLREHFEVRSQKNTLLEEKKSVLVQISKKKSLWRRTYELLMSGKLSILITLQRFGLSRAIKSLWKHKPSHILTAEKAKFLQKIFLKHGI